MKDMDINEAEEQKDDPEMLENMKLDIQDMDIDLSNVLANFSLGLPSSVTLDLLQLANRAINVDYKGRSYINVKLRTPHCSANVFKSGKVNVVGNKSEDDAKIACRKIARMIQKIGTKHRDIFQPKFVKFPGSKIRMMNFKISNIWASTQLPWNVHLPSFALQNRRSMYEPELDGGQAVTYKVTLLIGQSLQQFLISDW